MRVLRLLTTLAAVPSAACWSCPMRRGQSRAHPAKPTIRLMVIEPRALLGVGVREVFDRESQIEVVAQVRSPEEAIPVVDEAAPDVILVDAPHADASIAQWRLLRRANPDAAVVLLGGEDDDASIVDAIEIGATAHVAELAEPAELVSVIRRVAMGDDLLKDELSGRPDLMERIVDGVRDSIVADEAPPTPLTPRELEVLQLVARGLRNRDIASALSIRDQTVKNHLTSILHKLGAPNRTRAVTYAVRHGWLTLEPTGEVPDAAAAHPAGHNKTPEGTSGP